MVFYRKYRPQTLSELIGQDQIKLTLFKAHQAEKLSHAYLFCGPRGTGKTSTARIVAKMINCEVKGTEMETVPCNKCNMCLSITDGSNLDLMEIDAASNRGIDDIRDLKERIKLAPTQAKKKVYIIDEVHMLTTEAFNALLKTLEEPPSHVAFILATTEVHKLPQTILSRVQRLDFQTASTEDLLKALSRVVKEEKIEAEEAALKLLARKADGSFRDGLKLLDQIASSGGKITLQSVEEGLKSTSFKDILNLAGAISRKDSANALAVIYQLSEKGANVKEGTTQLLEVLRSLMLIQSQAGISVKQQFGSEIYEELTTLATAFNKRELVHSIQLIQDSLEQLKYTSIPTLPLEVAVVESCLGIQAPVISPNMIAPQMTMVQTIGEISSPSQPVNTGKDDKIPPHQMLKEQVEIAPSHEIIVLREKWDYILETIRPDNFSLEALLKQANLMGCDNGIVILEVPYAFHQRILETPRSRNLLESVLTDVLGKPARVTTTLSQRPVRVEELANVELAQDDEVIRIAAEIFNS